MDTPKTTETNAIKANSINYWGSATTQPQLSKEDFLKILESSNYHEIIDAELHGRSLDFTLQLNGEKYKGHSLISQDFIDRDRLSRKALVKDFKQVSISKETNTLPFHFKVSPVENKEINIILEKVLRIIDKDGDLLASSSSKPPSKPSPIFDQESDKNKRRVEASKLHIALSA